MSELLVHRDYNNRSAFENTDILLQCNGPPGPVTPVVALKVVFR